MREDASCALGFRRYKSRKMRLFYHSSLPCYIFRYIKSKRSGLCSGENENKATITQIKEIQATKA